MFEILKEPENWTTYLPLAKKQEIAERIAMNAISRYRITASYADDPILDQSVYAEDTGMRSRFLLGVLLKFYLHISFDPVEGTEYLLSADDYDRAAALHPLNTLERMKSDVKARDAVFDLLRDYKDLERMVNAELSATLTARNDMLPRIFAVLSATATPQALDQLTELEQGIREKAKDIAAAIKEAREETKQ